MPGTLYLIPNALGEGTLDTVIPDPVRARTASLQYFIAENAKSARAFLKLVGTTHPLRQSLQETHRYCKAMMSAYCQKLAYRR